MGQKKKGIKMYEKYYGQPYQFYSYFCKKYQRYLSKEDRTLHDCYNNKGNKKRPKGKRCHLLIRLPTPKTEKVVIR